MTSNNPANTSTPVKSNNKSKILISAMIGGILFDFMPVII